MTEDDEMALLDEQERKRVATELPEWSVTSEVMKRSFVFADFVAAMGFVNAVAELAEQQGHHPDIDIRYNRVDICTWSHDSGGVTERDARLARAVDGILARRG